MASAAGYAGYDSAAISSGAQGMASWCNAGEFSDKLPLALSGLTALVGREEETELLLRRWSRAKSGEGQVVLISGEAGIGKSRLTADLLESLAPEPHTRLRYFCSPSTPTARFIRSSV